MVYRVAYMIESGIPADQILMFTFTRKAAEEMKTRVEKLIGPKAKGLTISTYHSFCGKLLRRYYNVVGIKPNYTVYDEEDSISALTTVISSSEILKGLNVKDVKSAISTFKEEMISADEAMRRGGNTSQKKIATVYKRYTEYLNKSNALDFDDLTYLATVALQKSQEMREQVNDQYRYIVAGSSAATIVR